MNVQVMKLDDGYNTALTLHQTMTESSETMMTDLNNLITKLSEHWISSDSTIHINHLIEGYNKIGLFLESALNVTTNTVDFLVDMQTIRANTGGKKDIGERFKSSYTHKVRESIPDSEKYYFDPEVVNDYNNLIQINTNFEQFMHKVKDDSDELLLNWKKGHGRDETVYNFEQFTTIAGELNRYMLDAITELQTMKGNVENNISEA